MQNENMHRSTSGVFYFSALVRWLVFMTMNRRHFLKGGFSKILAPHNYKSKKHQTLFDAEFHSASYGVLRTDSEFGKFVGFF